MAKEAMKQLKVTQTKSLIGRLQSHRRTAKALGLRHIGHSVIKDDKPEIRGMIDAISFMVTVEEIEPPKPKPAPKPKEEAPKAEAKAPEKPAKSDQVGKKPAAKPKTTKKETEGGSK